MTLGLSDDLRSPFRGYDCIHWVAMLCTTTVYRWLFWDSPPSLRTSWSAVTTSPNFSARGTASPVRLLQGALVILVRKHISQFRSFGKWVKMLCFLDFDTTFVRRSESESWEVFAWCWHSFVFRMFCEFSNHCGKARDRFPDEGMLVSSLRVVAGLDAVSSDVSCCNDVEDVLALELEELVDNPGTTIGTKFSVWHWVRLPLVVNCGFWPLAQSYEYPCSSQRLINDRTAAVSSRICTVTKRSRSWIYCTQTLQCELENLCHKHEKTLCVWKRAKWVYCLHLPSLARESPFPVSETPCNKNFS